MKDLWNYLDGKKTNIAAFYNGVTWPSILVWFENVPPSEVVKVNMIIGLLMLFFGLGHKGYKAIKKKNG